MKTLKVNENNDIIFSGGHLQVVSGKEAESHLCRHFALANRGEMVFKKNRGIPFFDIALGSNPNPAQYEAAFRARMKEIPEVIAVTDFYAIVVDGVLKYTATIQTKNGEVKVNESI